MTGFTWDIDPTTDVLPISAAASRLARLMKQVRSNKRPVVITNKGYPAAVLVSPEMLTHLQGVLERYQHSDD